jgi:hypothetical protein
VRTRIRSAGRATGRRLRGHSRTCGEHWVEDLDATGRNGSPPLVRRAHRIHQPQRLPVRPTSARAESTPAGSASRASGPVHLRSREVHTPYVTARRRSLAVLRSCGEHLPMLISIGVSVGAPPLAEKTSVHPRPSGTRPAHLRSRGEHTHRSIPTSSTTAGHLRLRGEHDGMVTATGPPSGSPPLPQRPHLSRCRRCDHVRLTSARAESTGTRVGGVAEGATSSVTCSEVTTLAGDLAVER